MADSVAANNPSVCLGAYGRAVDTHIPLPELSGACPSLLGADPWVIRRAEALEYPLDLRWSVLVREPSGEPSAVSAHDRRGGCFVRINRAVDFHASASAIRVVARGYVAPATVRHLLLDQALPLALTASGRDVLHAAAVTSGDATIVLCGAAGSGKSTMAAALASQGFQVLSDDGVLVSAGRPARIVGAYPGLRLWPRSADVLGVTGATPMDDGSGKLRVEAEGATGEKRIDRIYVLGRGDTLAVTRLTGHAAVLGLVTHAFRSDLGDSAALARQLTRMQGLATLVSVWNFQVPTDLPAVLDAARALVRHARGSTAQW